MHIATPIAAAGAALATVVGLCTPALADTTTFTDARGDAPARYDLTRTTITNSADRLVVSQRVRDLRGGRTQIYGFNVRRGGEQYMLHSVRRASGKVTTRLTDSSGEQNDCKVMARWRPAKDTIRISMARSCIGKDGAVRISTMIGAGDGTAGDPADWTKTVRIAQG